VKSLKPPENRDRKDQVGYELKRVSSTRFQGELGDIAFRKERGTTTAAERERLYAHRDDKDELRRQGLVGDNRNDVDLTSLAGTRPQTQRADFINPNERVSPAQVSSNDRVVPSGDKLIPVED